MKPRILIFAFGLFSAGGLSSWFLVPSPDGGAKSQSSDIAAVEKSSRSLTNASRYDGRVPEGARMRAIRDSKNERDRMHSAIELARSLPLDQAGKWLEEGLFSQREGFALTLFTRILEKRWAAEDPDGYLVWQLGNGKGVSKKEMARLSESNPDLLLSSIRLIQDPEAQGQALANLAKARPDLALAELAKLNATELSKIGSLHHIFREMAQTDLETLQSAVEGFSLGMQREAQRAIYGQLLAKDFSGTLPQLVDLPNGLDIFMGNYDNNSKNRQIFLESFASLPKVWQSRLEGNSHYFTSGMNYAEILATDWKSYGLSEKSEGRFKGYTLFTEARKDQSGALELFQNADLNEAGRRYFLDVLNWNEGRETIEALMPNLEPADRDYIAQKMGDGAVGDGAVGSFPTLELKTAAQLSERLAKLENWAFTSLANSMKTWNAGEKRQFQNDYANLQGEERHRVTAMLTGAGDLELRAAAVSELLGNPEAQEVAGWNGANEVKMVSSLAVDFLKHDADFAATWVGGLPEGESQNWAMKNLAVNWKNYDPAAAEKWVDSLPAVQREEVRTFLKSSGN